MQPASVSQRHSTILEVERPAVFRLPAHIGLCANLQPQLIGCIWNFHDELVIAGHCHAAANMVTKIDQFFDPALQSAEAGLLSGRDHTAFRADRQAGPAALAINIDGQRLDRIAIIQRHRGNITRQALRRAPKGIILADELRDKGIVRLFIKGDRIGQLLNDAIIKHRNAI